MPIWLYNRTENLVLNLFALSFKFQIRHGQFYYGVASKISNAPEIGDIRNLLRVVCFRNKNWLFMFFVRKWSAL